MGVAILGASTELSLPRSRPDLLYSRLMFTVFASEVDHLDVRVHILKYKVLYR